MSLGQQTDTEKPKVDASPSSDGFLRPLSPPFSWSHHTLRQLSDVSGWDLIISVFCHLPAHVRGQAKDAFHLFTLPCLDSAVWSRGQQKARLDMISIKTLHDIWNDILSIARSVQQRIRRMAFRWPFEALQLVAYIQAYPKPLSLLLLLLFLSLSFLLYPFVSFPLFPFLYPFFEVWLGGT